MDEEKHIISNEIKSGLKIVSVPSNYFETLNLKELWDNRVLTNRVYEHEPGYEHFIFKRDK